MQWADTRPLAIITGVGPGTGSALVRRFALGGFQVAMLARKQARLDALAAEIPNAVAFPCDVADQASLQETLTHIVLRFGTPSVVITQRGGRIIWHIPGHRSEGARIQLPGQRDGPAAPGTPVDTEDGGGRGWLPDRDREYLCPARQGEFRRIRPYQGRATDTCRIDGA